MGTPLAVLAVALAVVAVHELGHLAAARLFDVGIAGVRIGVGPTLLRGRVAGVPVRVGLVPVVVLVDLLGRDPSDPVPSEAAHRALGNRPLWVRALVLLAGPAFNLAFPTILWFGHFIQQTHVAPPIIGTVVDGSAAQTAGLRPGDRIVAIDGDDVRSFDELTRRIEAAPQQDLRIHLVRGGEHLERFVVPRKALARTAVGDAKVVGRLGVLPEFYAPQIGITDPNGPAARAGLRTGDVVTSIDGEPIATVEALERWLPRLSKRSQVRLTYLRPSVRKDALGTWLYYDSHHAQILASAGAVLDTGMLPANTFVRTVTPNSPAAAAGLSPGDRIVAVDGARFGRWEFLMERLSAADLNPVELTVARPGAPPRTVTVRQRFVVRTDDRGLARGMLEFGATPYRRTFRPPLEPLRGRFAYAVSSALDLSSRMVQDVVTALLRFPARAAAWIGSRPLRATVTTADRLLRDPDVEALRLVSIATIVVGLLHLLPLPVLDAGRLLFDAVDVLRRRPSSRRLRMRVGFAVLVLLIALMFLLIAHTDPTLP